MAGFSLESLRGTGMVILQILRAFTVITLVAADASYWILMIKADKARNYFVFECASHFFASIVCLVLIVAEFPIHGSVKGYFSRTWPVLSEQYGIAWLGIAMVVIGCDLLGNLNRPAFDPENLGPHFSQLVLAAAVLAITFGVLNLICSFVWRDSKDGITSRDIRANGSLANSNRQSLPDYSSAARSNSTFRNEKTRSKFVSMFWRKDTGEKTRPHISGPFPAHKDVEREAPVDDRMSPIIPGLKRPDTALHPIHAGHNSVYSEAHMSRF